MKVENRGRKLGKLPRNAPLSGYKIREVLEYFELKPAGLGRKIATTAEAVRQWARGTTVVPQMARRLMDKTNDLGIPEAWWDNEGQGLAETIAETQYEEIQDTYWKEEAVMQRRKQEQDLVGRINAILTAKPSAKADPKKLKQMQETMLDTFLTLTSKALEDLGLDPEEHDEKQIDVRKTAII